MRKPDRKEQREAKIDGASLTPNSGRNFIKGDAKLFNFLVDYKHNAKSFTLNLDAWDKHKRDAWQEGHRSPVISVVFGDDKTKVAIIEWEYFKDYLDMIGEQ